MIKKDPEREAALQVIRESKKGRTILVGPPREQKKQDVPPPTPEQTKAAIAVLRKKDVVEGEIEARLFAAGHQAPAVREFLK